VSRAQVLEALVEMLGVPASRIGEAYGHELALQVLPRSRGFLTAINLSWPHEEFGDWIPEAQLALRLAQRFDTDAVIANVGHSKQNPDPGRLHRHQAHGRDLRGERPQLGDLRRRG
jgi:hypothetical protein